MLDNKSSDLTTFNTIYGCYKFKRYPFGLNSAQDDFQRKMEEAYENLDLGLIIDDTAICSADERLKAALDCACKKNMKLNRDKCIFGTDSIPYFGHLLISEGIKLEPEKTRALSEMPLPKNNDQLQKLLDMLNYLSRYISNLSSLNKNPRELPLTDQ
ncbi:hypothetical protein QYM36_014585 [Artemia franciscana]|uniref:Reverse transcriptase domain-containing protein n=1 Tax=Artemia franciscana TaxID=6661 RepID=A0AA88L166_ARTSF|nr:hypothetical protein QYM36_014585 [Artemia franciscana]